MNTSTWNEQLRFQITMHWEEQVRPRLAGLTDAEYFWRPAPGCWTVHPRGEGTAAIEGGSGDFTIDFEFPEPSPPPMTTIAWRLGHVIVGVLAMRNAGHFGRAPVDYTTFDYAGTARDALHQLDTEYAAWLAGVEGLGEDGLSAPSGPAEGPWAEYPMSTLVLHIHRELIHHLAEVALLRDLYAHTQC
ncbi:DinB family protein [Tomitella fengzijianii]|uniref:DinB family protein n=1 Tax=Tomitella fengzijianii TaxID=2597660 RepID=A0A516X2S4_9ACTN|nr:DinB family protein [Tomitella fengzijianii]QDQ96931.1 DinB family protein [Tomitella fengzijianii]